MPEDEVRVEAVVVEETYARAAPLVAQQEQFLVRRLGLALRPVRPQVIDKPALAGVQAGRRKLQSIPLVRDEQRLVQVAVEVDARQRVTSIVAVERGAITDETLDFLYQLPV